MCTLVVLLYHSYVMTPSRKTRKALVEVLDRNSLKGICVPPQFTVVGILAFLVVQATGEVAGSTIWKGIKRGVFDAGARPKRIAAIGSG